MRRIRKRKNLIKERVIMAASSVMVLGALTAAGLMMRNDKSSRDEGYIVDLTTIENNASSNAEQIGESELVQNTAQNATHSDDLDYDPYFQEANSLNVENPDLSGSKSMSDGVKNNKDNVAEEKKTEEVVVEKEEDKTAISTAMQPSLNFTDADMLNWPIVGNILVNFSMDKTVYFPTLQQYKYNPAIIIQANQGDLVTAAAAGKVLSVTTDPQIGQAVTIELGSGYQVTYGQLTNILVSEGSFVALGDIIGEVGEPTKYFSVEGTNVYFKLTKDGQPVNPMTKLS